MYIIRIIIHLQIVPIRTYVYQIYYRTQSTCTYHQRQILYRWNEYSLIINYYKYKSNNN